MDMTGWTKYDGTGQPVPDGTVVEIFLRCEVRRGWASDPAIAEEWAWGWDWIECYADYDILYYKVIE